MSTSKNNKNYYFFIGTEAELIKLLPVLREFEARKILYKIIASGQNPIETSELLTFITKKKIDFLLYKGRIKQTALSLLVWFIKTLGKGILTLSPELST